MIEVPSMDTKMVSGKRQVPGNTGQWTRQHNIKRTWYFFVDQRVSLGRDGVHFTTCSTDYQGALAAMPRNAFLVL